MVQFLMTPTLGTPSPNAATIETRTFNDCPVSTLTVTNNYPASIQITDQMHMACVGFANLSSPREGLLLFSPARTRRAARCCIRT